jgi:hypothetical protein
VRTATRKELQEVDPRDNDEYYVLKKNMNIQRLNQTTRSPITNLASMKPGRGEHDKTMQGANTQLRKLVKTEVALDDTKSCSPSRKHIPAGGPNFTRALTRKKDSKTGSDTSKLSGGESGLSVPTCP